MSKNGKVTIYLDNYNQYGTTIPIVRNYRIVLC